MYEMAAQIRREQRAAVRGHYMPAYVDRNDISGAASEPLLGWLSQLATLTAKRTLDLLTIIEH